MLAVVDDIDARLELGFDDVADRLACGALELGSIEVLAVLALLIREVPLDGG